MQVEIAKLKAEIDAYAKPRKETIKDIEGPMLVQAKIADSGFKLDLVECAEEWLANYTIVVRRLDTGEIVEGPTQMTKEQVKTFNQGTLSYDGSVVDVPEVNPATGEVTGKRKRVKLSKGSDEKN
jgi:hypothetical protein